MKNKNLIKKWLKSNKQFINKKRTIIIKKTSNVKNCIQSFLMVIVAMVISAFLLTWAFYGIYLIIEGWQVVEELKNICISCS